MQTELFPRTKRRVAPGVWHVPGWLNLDQQIELIIQLRHWTQGGWYTPKMLDGTPMKHPIACLGYRWKPYTYFDPLVSLPGELTLLAIQALIDAEMTEFLPYSPQTAIVNYFPHGSSLGMHQDNSEDPAVIERGSPIVTISLGDTATFRLGNCEHKGLPWQNLELRSGDLLVMGGFNRLAYHGVMEIEPNTAPKGLQMKQAGRISMTLREVYERKV